MEEEQCLHECENYIQSHNISSLLKDCIVQLCVNKPENPVSFLRQYLQKLERVSKPSHSTCILKYINIIFLSSALPRPVR